MNCGNIQEEGLKSKIARRFFPKFDCASIPEKIDFAVKSGHHGYTCLFEQLEVEEHGRRKFSPEATAVFAAGRELWQYYHRQPGCNVNAALYDIREHFQGRDEKGKMNNSSKDKIYNELIDTLGNALDALAKKIEPKVYEYGFLPE
ncbi:MAG: hypothetical protein LBR06_06655 [Bacteroidales bacterium]|jgi:hypothetical protein|nr:hypothetical protein [Bacteroidales bacterium]